MRNGGANVTQNRRAGQVTIERLTHECLDVRFLRRKGFFYDGWVTVGATLKWPRVARMRIARYRLILDLRDRIVPQQIRVSWTKVHLGGERPWMHCPHCEIRVARLYAGLGGYFCRSCIGSPPYATPTARRARQSPLSGVQTPPFAGRRSATNDAVSTTPGGDASADLRAAQTRGDEP